MGSKTIKTQVTKEHYFNGYDNMIKFMYYFHEIELTKSLNPKSILEIGVGNKTYYNYMKQQGYEIKSLDFDKTLNPDIIADVRNTKLKEESFDVVVAFEVMEHLPYSEFQQALKELRRVSRKHVILSIPFRAITFELIFRIPMLGRLIKKPFVRFFYRTPFLMKDLKMGFKGNNQHYWEIGTKSYPIKRIIKKIENSGFKIISESNVPLDAGSFFFVLEKL